MLPFLFSITLMQIELGWQKSQVWKPSILNLKQKSVVIDVGDVQSVTLNPRQTEYWVLHFIVPNSSQT